MAELGLTGVRVLVTGAGGFVGGRLATRLARAGALVDAPGCDLADGEAVRRAVDEAQPEVVFHAGAVVDLSRDVCVAVSCVRTNVGGTLNLLAALADRPSLRRLVYVSTTDVYGDGPAPFDEEQRERPLSPYGATKLAGEHLCASYATSAGIPVTIARVATAYGPGQRAERLVPSAIRAFLRREVLDAGDGEQRRDLVYVDDVVDGLLRCSTSDAARGATINLGHERPTSWREVLDRARLLVGADGPAPRWGALPARPGEPRLWASSGKRARELLGWQPTTSLDDGLAETIAFYREKGATP